MRELLDRLAATRLLVVGDVMLDRYWFGDVDRVSPEAPVPVIRVNRTEARLGGAANVAKNVRSLGARATLMAVIGNDEAGTCIRRMAESSGIESALLTVADVRSTVKLRLFGRSQQLLRADFEEPPSHELLSAKLQDFRPHAESADAIVFSDYGKGGLGHVAEMIGIARQFHKPVFVAPSGSDYRKYRGATGITPNPSEMREVIGPWHSEDELRRKAGALREDLGIEALLLTRSEEGMTLFLAGAVYHEATPAREVFDVSGAGDTVISVLATARAAGAGWPEAVRLANVAAGVVVGKVGTTTVTPDEIEAQLESSS